MASLLAPYSTEQVTESRQALTVAGISALDAVDGSSAGT